MLPIRQYVDTKPVACQCFSAVMIWAAQVTRAIVKHTFCEAHVRLVQP